MRRSKVFFSPWGGPKTFSLGKKLGKWDAGPKLPLNTPCAFMGHE